MKTFPLFVKSENKAAVIIGGGSIALRRARILIPFGFKITLISPEVSPEIEELSQQIHIIRAPYAPHFIQGADIIIAATNNREVNHSIYLDACKHGTQISVADCEAECSFYFPAIAQNGNITAGITGNGKNHSAVKLVAAKIREVL